MGGARRGGKAFLAMLSEALWGQLLLPGSNRAVSNGFRGIG